MGISLFIQKSGFKVLAMAKLTQCEYSIALYLMNCAVSGLDQIVTTEMEIASLIGVDESQVSEAVASLSERKIIVLHYSDQWHMTQNSQPSMRLGFQFAIEKWLLGEDKNSNSHDALIYPFMRHKKAPLEVLSKNEYTASKEQENSHTETWKRVTDSFLSGRNLDDREIDENISGAKILVETHPVDQVILLLRHFKKRIASLSLLASNWDHYQELFEQETQKVDLTDARKKHKELDEELKINSKKWLEKAEDFQLSLMEVNILKLLIRHRYPRRQLFWAYQARSRYTNLKDFFEENQALMLAVTSTGHLVKKTPHLGS